MSEPKQGKAPFTLRLAVWFFSILFGLLTFWLTGFLRQDIRNWPGPAYETFEQKMLDPKLVQRQVTLDAKIAETKREIENQQQRRRILGESTFGSQKTMNQLIEFHRVALAENAELNDKQDAAIAEAIQLFIANQRKYQELSGTIADLDRQLWELQEDHRDLTEIIERERAPIHQAHQSAVEWHHRKMAAIELAVVVPFAVVAFLLFLKGRQGIYTPLIYAFGLAVLVRVGMVLHEYFPSRHFKYVVILVAIIVVVWILVHLLRMVAFPKRGWLVKRYREAYERFECPICDSPIRRGPMRYVYWTTRGLKNLSRLGETTEAADEPYVCPSCATPLFEECPVCHKTRHSLLPACEHCGDEREIEVGSRE